jgi:hypothetical protein
MQSKEKRKSDMSPPTNRRSQYRFYLEIATDVTTRNSEHKDIVNKTQFIFPQR